jgi:ATP-binding cassette subfamily F protein 3
MLMGQETPDAGTLRLGQNVTVAYYDQELHLLNPQRTVLDEVWQGEPLWTMEQMRSYLGRFLFSEDEVFQRIEHLSGGEKSRVALAKLMLSKANFLILDEPTNHLDIPGREALERALTAYTGTVLLVSHDRYFVDRVVTRLFYMRDGVCDDYPGNYSAYQAHLAARQQATPLPAAKVVKKPVTTAAAPRPRPERLRKAAVIEQEISQVEAQLATLQQSIDALPQDGDWQQLVDLTTQQGAAAARLDRLMNEWEASMQGGGSR